MVFDRRAARSQELRRLTREIRAGRLRMLAVLLRDHQATAARLQGAYRDILDNLEPDIERLAGASDVTPAAIRRMRDATARRLDELGSLTSAEAATLQRAGVEAGYRAGIRNLSGGGVSSQFTERQLRALQQSIEFVDSPAFQQAVNGLGPHHADRVGNLIIAAVEKNENPRSVARIVRRYFTQSRSPMADALRLTRTTQIYSAREGTRQTYIEHDIGEWIWSSALDARTCMMCISQHGTRHPISDTLNEHHNGRCAMIPVTPTWASLGFDGGGEPVYETGVDWFNRQDEDAQRRIVGPQLLDAISRNDVQFSPEAITGQYDNAIFGQMLRPRNVSDILQSR